MRHGQGIMFMITVIYLLFFKHNAEMQCSPGQAYLSLISNLELVQLELLDVCIVVLHAYILFI